MTKQSEFFSDETLAASEAPLGSPPRQLRHGGKWQRESATRWIVRQTLDHGSMQPDRREEFTSEYWRMPGGTEQINMSNNHHRHGRDQGAAHEPHTPAWMRLHHDWRFWFAVTLMFACMIIYVMSEDLAWRPVVRSNAPSPSAAGQP